MRRHDRARALEVEVVDKDRGLAGAGDGDAWMQLAKLSKVGRDIFLARRGRHAAHPYGEVRRRAVEQVDLAVEGQAAVGHVVVEEQPELVERQNALLPAGVVGEQEVFPRARRVLVQEVVDAEPRARIAYDGLAHATEHVGADALDGDSLLGGQAGHGWWRVGLRRGSTARYMCWNPRTR